MLIGMGVIVHERPPHDVAVAVEVERLVGVEQGAHDSGVACGGPSDDEAMAGLRRGVAAEGRPAPRDHVAVESNVLDLAGGEACAGAVDDEAVATVLLDDDAVEAIANPVGPTTPVLGFVTSVTGNPSPVTSVNVTLCGPPSRSRPIAGLSSIELSAICATTPLPSASVPDTQIPTVPVFKTLLFLMEAPSARVRIPTPPGSSAVVVAVPATRSTLTPVILTFLEAMSIPAERALKQRRVLMESFLL